VTDPMRFRWINPNSTWPLLIETIFFDLDDTLCDNLGAIVKAREDTINYILSKFKSQSRSLVRNIYNSVFSEQERRIGELSNRPDTFKNGFELRLDRFNRLLQALHLPNANTAKELVTVYGESKIRNLHAFPEVPKVLRRLRKSFVLGIITNGFSDLQTEELEVLGLTGFFDHVIISQEVGMQKPGEGIFLEALRRSSTKPGRCLMIGNSLKDDILTPKKLGMCTGLVLHNKRQNYDLANLDFIIQDLSLLPDLIRHP